MVATVAVCTLSDCRNCSLLLCTDIVHKAFYNIDALKILQQNIKLLFLKSTLTTTVGSADVRDWQMAGALRQPPTSPGCR